MATTPANAAAMQVIDNYNIIVLDCKPAHLTLVGVKAAIVETPSVMFTRITSHDTLLTKRVKIDDAGKLHKEPAAHMTEGQVDRVYINSAGELADELVKLSHEQAHVYGVVSQKNCRVLSKKQYTLEGKPVDTVTRTKEFFNWSDRPGVLMLDYDPQEGKTPLSRDELIAAVKKLIPEFDKCAYVWWCSGSSYIYEGDKEISGLNGQRVYILVKSAADIERAGKVLFDRLWLDGYGHYEVSSAGTALERSIIDGSVWQPTRFDFASGAKCTPPLEQRRGKPEAHEGEFFDTVNLLGDLTLDEAEELKALKEQARGVIEPKRKEARDSWTAKREQEMLACHKGGATDEDRTRIKQTVKAAIDNQTLLGDFVIQLVDGSKVTVGEILDSPDKFHGQETLDPLEPEYDGSKQVGKLYLIGQQPILHSQAHGGRSFRLIRQTQHIGHVQGNTSDTVNRTLDSLRTLPNFFDMGDSLVTTGQTLQHLNNDLLAYHLGSNLQYQVLTGNGQKNINPPPDVVKQIMALKSARGLKPLKAVLTAPVILEDGCVISRPGYDKGSQLYLNMASDIPAVPGVVNDETAKRALNVLMQPFVEFDIRTPVDRGALLAAILTAIQRPMLPAAPAIGIDAPVQGTGKTYLAQCLGSLTTGGQIPVSPPIGTAGDEEMRKRITTALKDGDQVMLLDNVLGVFNSASLAASLTSPCWSDRLLGGNDNLKAHNRVLVLITGNQLKFAGDMPRRVLVCRLDAGVENPQTRKFTQRPDHYIRTNRQTLVCAGLTLIRGYLQSEHCRTGGAALDSTASFEVWDRLIRQTVVWVSLTFGKGQFADPQKAITAATEEDPEKEDLRDLLESIVGCMGLDEWFKSNDLALASSHGGVIRPTQIIQELINRNELPNPKTIGRTLSNRKDRVVSGLKLVQGKDSDQRTIFKVTRG